MQKGLVKDLLITGTIFITDIIYMPMGIFMPFFYSYLKQSDLSITFSFIYTLIIYQYFGNVFSSAIMPRLLFILGIKKTFMFGGVCCFFLYILGIFTNNYSFYVFSFFCGICFNLKSLPTNYLLSVKYENGVSYLAYAYAGQSIGVLFWAFMMNRIVNPKNLSMSEETEVNGFVEHFYPQEVNKNFQGFLLVNSFVSIIVIFGASFFIQEPKNKNGNLLLWLKATFLRDKKSIDCLNLKIKNFRENYKKVTKTSKSNTSIPRIIIQTQSEKIKNSDENEKTVELLTSSEFSTNSLEKDINDTIYSKKFLGFIVITFIKNSSSAVFQNCTKIIGNDIINDDRLLSYIYALFSITDIFGRFMVPYFWKKFGFYKTYILNFSFIIFINLFFVFFGYNSKIGFVFTMLMVGLIWAFNYLLGHYTIFALWAPDKAVGLSKVFDIYFVFYSLYGSFMVKFFVGNGYFRTCFFVFAVFESVAFFFFVRNYKEFGDK